jgi:hypothetical protein
VKSSTGDLSLLVPLKLGAGRLGDFPFCSPILLLFEKPFLLLFSDFTIYPHFGGLRISNSPFTVMVTDFVSILSISINPSLLCAVTISFAVFLHILILY